MPAIEINGVDPSTYGLSVRIAPDLLSTPSLAFDAIELPERAGARPGLRTIGSRGFPVEGILESTSLANHKSNLDNLINLVTRVQPSTVVFQWSTDRRLSVECLGVKVEPLGTLFGLYKYNVRIDFDAPDPPFWQGTTQHSVASIGSTAVALPMGNAPVFPQIKVQGPCTSGFSVLLKNSTGGQVEIMGFSQGPTSTQYYAIDMDKMTVYRNDTGAFNSGTNVLANWSSGDFFAVLPEYGSYRGSSWATLEMENTTSTGALATALYYKAYY